MALVLGWALGGGNKVKEVESIQRPEDAVFYSRERLFQRLPLNEQTLGPYRGYETGGANF